MRISVKIAMLFGVLLLVVCMSLTACDKKTDTNQEQTTENETTRVETNPEEQVGELAFELNDRENAYIVTGIGTFTGTKLVIPATYNDLPVWSIAEAAFQDCTQLTEIELPEGIRIGKYAFSGCTGLTRVTIPKHSHVEWYAFEKCTGIESVRIEQSSSDYYCFENCSALKTIEYAEDAYISLSGMGEISWKIEDPNNPPEDAEGVSSRIRQENGEDVYDENGEPVLDYYAHKKLPIESVTGGVLGEWCSLVSYPNLNSTNVTNYTLAENTQMVDGVVVSLICDGESETEFYSVIWIDPLVESLDCVALREKFQLGKVINFSGLTCLKSITVGSEEVYGHSYRFNSVASTLKDIYYSDSIVSWLENGGPYLGDTCTIHCADGDISKELGAAMTYNYSQDLAIIQNYLNVFNMYSPYIADIEDLVKFKAEYDEFLAKKTEAEYDSYQEYAIAEKGTAEYALYEEYLAFRTARSRYLTSKNRRLNDLMNMHHYYNDIVQANESIDIADCVATFVNVHLPVWESTFGCKIEYEQGKQGDLIAITNLDQLPDTVRSRIKDLTRLIDEKYQTMPRTPEQVKMLIDQATAALIEPGYITEQELAERLSKMY